MLHLLKKHLLAGLLKLEIEEQSGLFHAMYFIAARSLCQHISWEVMQSFPNGRAGFWDHQICDGLQAVLAAWITKSHR